MIYTHVLNKPSRAVRSPLDEDDSKASLALRIPALICRLPGKFVCRSLTALSRPASTRRLGTEATSSHSRSHRHQREQLEAALQRDGRANREYIKDDIAKAQGVLDWALAQASALERAGPTGPLTLRGISHGFIGSPDAGVWPSAKASGVANLLPASAQN